jgi:hypothetical protein
MKVCRECKCKTDAHLLDLCIGWKWVITFMIQLMYAEGKSHQNYFVGWLDIMLGGGGISA